MSHDGAHAVPPTCNYAKLNHGEIKSLLSALHAAQTARGKKGDCQLLTQLAPHHALPSATVALPAPRPVERAPSGVGTKRAHSPDRVPTAVMSSSAVGDGGEAAAAAAAPKSHTKVEIAMAVCKMISAHPERLKEAQFQALRTLITQFDGKPGKRLKNVCKIDNREGMGALQSATAKPVCTEPLTPVLKLIGAGVSGLQLGTTGNP